MAEAGDAEPIDPTTIADDRAKEGFVRVSVLIPNLQVQSKLKIMQFKIEKHAQNATVKTDFGSGSSTTFKIEVTGNAKTNMSGKWYMLNVRKLPYTILSDQCYIEIKEGRILVFLAKEDPHQSWQEALEEGLDTYEEEDEDNQT